VEKTSNGGISIKIENPIKLTSNLIKEILHVYGIHNGRITIREPGLTEEQFIDVLNGNAAYVPSLLVINKIDLVDQLFLEQIQPKIQRQFIPISAESNTNIDELKKAIYHKLDFVRIYMHPKGQKIDYKEPMIMRRGCTIEDLCNKIHRRVVQDFRFAYVSGPSAKFDDQKVGLDHMLLDEDVVTIVKRINAL
jgi:ribosome-interacting GTPase 1